MICVFCGNKIDDTSTICPCCHQHVTPVKQETEPNYYQPVQEPNYPPQQENHFYHIPEQQETKNSGEYTGQAQGQNNDQPYENQGYYQQPYYQPQQNYYNQPSGDVSRIVENSKTLGILSIVLGIFLSGIVGVILGAIGLSKINSIYPMFPGIPDVQTAKKLNGWGIGLSIGLRALIFIVWLLIVFFGIAAAGFGSEFGQGLEGLY